MGNQQPIVYIGYDRTESSAFYTLCHSIWSRASGPVNISALMLSQLKHVYTRSRHPLQSTDFSISRFLVPWLCDYQGHALFMDCDMLILDDIYHLWDLRDDTYAVKVIKHNHIPKEETKMLGQKQTKYEKKNWSSVMLFNNEKCKALTPNLINTCEPLHLHRFHWLESEDLIGELPHEWNFLVNYDSIDDYPAPKNLHYTTQAPWWEQHTEFNEVWRQENKKMINVDFKLPPS